MICLRARQIASVEVIGAMAKASSLNERSPARILRIIDADALRGLMDHADEASGLQLGEAALTATALAFDQIAMINVSDYRLQRIGHGIASIKNRLAAAVNSRMVARSGRRRAVQYL